MTLLRTSRPERCRCERDAEQCQREIAAAERALRAGEPREDLLLGWWLDQKAELAILAEQMGLEVGEPEVDTQVLNKP